MGYKEGRDPKAGTKTCFVSVGGRTSGLAGGGGGFILFIAAGF